MLDYLNPLIFIILGIFFAWNSGARSQSLIAGIFIGFGIATLAWTWALIERRRRKAQK